MAARDRGPEAPASGGEEAAAPRFVVGIDLGTTNCAVAFVDSEAEPWEVRTFPVLQLVAPGETEARETLPSFFYEAAVDEMTAAALELPWSRSEARSCVGTLAREQGSRAPGRLVASAKSWLSHSGVDRTAPLLPWHGAADVVKRSPLAVSAEFLAHIHQAWNEAFADHPLAAQDVVLTVPASFDEVARELSVEAARIAGLPRVVLLEEPQAAFYSWIQRQGDGWDRGLVAGQKVLICDIGGGTTDLTLIEVRAEAGGVRFHRVAVGEHLILGGDNLDLALAHEVERRAALDEALSPAAWSVLIRQCQRIKELLLGEAAPAETTVSLGSGGARLIADAKQVRLRREEVEELLLDGFLPPVDARARPASRASGFQEFGLPYAADPGITRYLAEFLARHGSTGGATAGPGGPPARPDAVLLNGGVFASESFRRRLLETLQSWYPAAQGAGWAPRILENERLDLAVARGAAYFGMVRRGLGVRIGGGLPRSYYIGVEGESGSPLVALCLMPAGIEEGERVTLDHRFELRIRQPVELAVFVSASRTTDGAGDLVEVEPESLRPLPPIRTVLKSGRKTEAEAVAVRLEARLTEIGTLEAWCREEGGSRSWRLQFDARSATRTDLAGHGGEAERQGFVDEETVALCGARIRSTFAVPPSGGALEPARLVRELERISGLRRQQWPASLLRALWESLMEVEGGRGLGVGHEARWLNLAGFALRPGYGLALDDWRMARTWRHFLGRKPEHGRNEMCRAEWWVFWRRLAGGLTAGQQQALASPLIAMLKAAATGRPGGRASVRRRPRGGGGTGGGRGVEFKGGSHETAELWRLLGALEWLGPELKSELGDWILRRLEEAEAGLWNGAGLWSLGRLGARVPQYGPLNTVLSIDIVDRWLATLLGLDASDRRIAFAGVQLARLTGDRYRDIAAGRRRSVCDWLAAGEAPASYVKLVEEGGRLDGETEAAAYGETLPAGIRLR